jgi:hypothetical protein
MECQYNKTIVISSVTGRTVPLSIPVNNSLGVALAYFAFYASLFVVPFFFETIGLFLLRLGKAGLLLNICCIIAYVGLWAYYKSIGDTKQYMDALMYGAEHGVAECNHELRLALQQKQP